MRGWALGQRGVILQEFLLGGSGEVAQFSGDNTAEGFLDLVVLMRVKFPQRLGDHGFGLREVAELDDLIVLLRYLYYGTPTLALTFSYSYSSASSSNGKSSGNAVPPPMISPSAYICWKSSTTTTASS